MRPLKFSDSGVLLENPIGAHVVMDYEGRRLLGEVINLRTDTADGERIRVLNVRHFNGEQWPVSPQPWDVLVLERD